MKKQQKRNRPLLNTTIKPEANEIIENLMKNYGKNKSEIVDKALEFGLYEIRLYYQMEQKFDNNFSIKHKKDINKRYPKINVGKDAKPPLKFIQTSPSSLLHKTLKF